MEVPEAEDFLQVVEDIVFSLKCKTKERTKEKTKDNEEDLDIVQSYNQVLFFCIFQRKALCAILYPVQKLGINKTIPRLFQKYSIEQLKK